MPPGRYAYSVITIAPSRARVLCRHEQDTAYIPAACTSYPRTYVPYARIHSSIHILSSLGSICLSRTAHPTPSRNPRTECNTSNTLVLRNIDKSQEFHGVSNAAKRPRCDGRPSASRYRNGFVTILAFSEVIVVLSKFGNIELPVTCNTLVNMAQG
jgi:hypothetical protein